MNDSTPDSETTLREKTPGMPDPGARRLRMREFQARLVDRMQAARGGSDTRAGQLGVLVGERRCLIDLPQTGEIVAVGPITRVPLTQPWFLGLTNIRGNLISIVDFAHFLGDAPTVIDKQSRIIAFAPSLSVSGGLLVSHVVGLRNLADMQAQAGTSGTDDDWQRQQYKEGDNVLWQLVDLIAITRNQRFLNVAA